MIELKRAKNHKWILQKNVSSSKIITAYLDCIKNSEVDYENVKEELRDEGLYSGRSKNGAKNTMGVRFSQMCFYMFGYQTGEKYFMPSPMTNNMFNRNCKISPEKNALITMYSMQFPSPYSNTPEEFNIYIGRLIVKLLLDDRISSKLYIDEIIWFLPFIETINNESYDELIDSIKEYRKLTYDDKLQLFKQSTRNYNELYANVAHEFNYYFLRIFEGFGVISYHPDVLHNNGNIFSFRHGNSETYRTDSYKSRTKIPGYITLSPEVCCAANLLNQKFSAFDEPTSNKSSFIFSRADWLNTIYNIEPIQYLSCISQKFEKIKIVSDVINKMVYASKYGSRDGKEFEKSLQPVIQLFKETRNVEIISGAGNTDLLCAMEDITTNHRIYKINVEAKTRKSALEEINPRRIEAHIRKVNAEFCIVVAPKFASGVSLDIEGMHIATIKAEDLGNYCYKECSSSSDCQANFQPIYSIVMNNMGQDISSNVQNYMDHKYGICIQ